MIPKIIHYCWFGGNTKPELIEKCIMSWKNQCPGWEIVEWNEKNYDINSNLFTQEAYRAGKWAFVSDYARLDILKRFGGVYLDTDVEIITENPFDRLLQYSDVVPFENARGINTGMMYAAEKDSSLCSAFLEAYGGLHFSVDNMVVNTRMNKPVLDALLEGLKYNGETQVFGSRYIMGTEEYGKLMVHYGTRSWCDNLPQYTVRTPNRLIKKLRTPLIFEKLESLPRCRSLVNIYTFLVYDLYDLGLSYFIKLHINRRKQRERK